MAERDFKKPPFTLDRTRRGGLAIQLADNLRRTIETGYYRAGDLLPPIRDLATLTGVSQVIATRAVRILKEERLVSPRPHIGIIVCARDRPLWKGQILLVVPPGIGNAADNAAQAALRDSLTAAGYLVFVATVPYAADGTCDFALLDTMMRQRFDLVVQLHDLDLISERLSSRKVPFVRLTRGSPKPGGSLVGAVVRRDDLCLPEFLAHCRERGVGSVLQVTALRNGPDAVPALRAAGIRAENWRVIPPKLQFDTRTISPMTASAFAKRLSGEWAPRPNGSRPLPDLIFFRDDHLASGALLALAGAGVRIPDDLHVVTWANREEPPASPAPLTRMEQDNAAIGSKVADCVLQHLRTGAFPEDAVVGPQYVRGETF